MEQLSETARLDRELEQAQRDLRETLEQVNHKVEQVALLHPQAIIRSNPVALPLAAGLLGFTAGSDGRPRQLVWVVSCVLLGAALAIAHWGSNHGSNGTS
jgi:hypothetical protein